MERGEPVSVSELRTRPGCDRAIDRLLEMSPADVARNDIAVLNLMCAPALPGSENLDIPKCLGRLGNLARFVGQFLGRYREQIKAHPNFDCEAKEIMGHLITLVKQQYGAAYSPTARDDLLAGRGDEPFSDASEVLIHGLLHDDRNRRWGTCTSIPVLITAVARQLGLPVRLALAKRHVFCRWDDGKGTSFNIEASNPAGMVVSPDEHYTQWPFKLTWEERRSGQFVRSLAPAEEFATFIKGRVYCMIDAGYYDDTLRWISRAMQYCPGDPNFHEDAAVMVDAALKHRWWRKFPEKKLPACNDPNQPWMRVGKHLRSTEVPNLMTILAHHNEHRGNLGEARKFFEDACRYSTVGFNEHRDLQRFLKAHPLRRRPGPLLPPANLCKNRFFRLTCPLEKQAEALRSIADVLEREGDLLKAHDAMFDLYLFDPSDDELFWHMKGLEDNAWCQKQLDAQMARTQQKARQIGQTFRNFGGGAGAGQSKSKIPDGPIKFVQPYDDRERFTMSTR